MQPKSDAILQAFMDSFAFPLWLVDSNHNILMNEYALELSNSGFDIKSKISKMRLGDTKNIVHNGTKYKIHSKDINHGTNCLVFTMEKIIDDVVRLKESTSKLRKVLGSV